MDYNKQLAISVEDLYDKLISGKTSFIPEIKYLYNKIKYYGKISNTLGVEDDIGSIIQYILENKISPQNFTAAKIKSISRLVTGNEGSRYPKYSKSEGKTVWLNKKSNIQTKSLDDLNYYNGIFCEKEEDYTDKISHPSEKLDIEDYMDILQRRYEEGNLSPEAERLYEKYLGDK
jgi:hypothetical protein